ncbi:MAG: 3-keto-steroid reductase [Bogoriella megaspora]|nr:MAG: 3-keto-steroid reductase [Bogoriella megaspora]
MAAEPTPFTVLVTGANGGLGYSISCRLIDEFLQSRRRSETLLLIVTARSTAKSEDTLSRLRQYVKKARAPAGRVQLQAELVDLSSIISVQKLSQRLLEKHSKLDVIVLNAGIGGWIGVDWLDAMKNIPIDWKHATTWPTFKISGTGWVTKPQIPSRPDAVREPKLGEIFAANVFGHYLLVHYIAPLLSRSYLDEEPGRIIWISSIEASREHLDFDDLQALESNKAYEASKRVTDLLSLTYDMPETRPWVDTFLSLGMESEDQVQRARPKMYVTHPGVCATGIFPLPYILGLCMTMAFYIARLMGSQWHTCSSYLGACSAVWVALAPQSQLDAAEAKDGPGKWGSACDPVGNERVARTEVDGWGWGGKIGELRRKGRKRGARDLTEEDRDAFIDSGRRVWKEMEELREDWEARLRAASVDAMSTV